ncbi:putative lipoate-protein ligase A [Gimesia panareensis]|uniref:Putative lipoate-protein ligase A n=1 Tax=Gimesia panareensis TaxID=2527978 RepID=A0A518FU56_9PLAN|nr:lipoate--protein ligase family protein [Gimesia panareensis]QDV19876.1 putative lipoate-protein ligase A [Gimesia panareensis]
MQSQTCHLSETVFPTPEENLALEEGLLYQINEQNSAGCLRIWEVDQYTVIMGSSNQTACNVDLTACRRDQIPVLRRCTGGGTVLLGPGCFIFSLFLRISPEQHLAGIEATTRDILDRIRETLNTRFPAHYIDLQGISDLTIQGRKFSGNSQRWLTRTLLHHGTILYDFDLDRIPRYLTSPEREPEYRSHRNHLEFVTNYPVKASDLRQALIETWQADQEELPLPVDRVRQLVAEKYATEKWNLRR